MLTRNYIAFVLICFLLSVPTMAQSGGTFVVEQSVIGSGGGTDASGGQFGLSATIGQPVAGQRVTNFWSSVHAGFWNPPPMAPTAAGVTISGHVTTQAGQGIRSVFVTLTLQNGSRHTCSTGSLGYYHFDDITTGQTVIVRVSANRYIFGQPSLVLNLTDLVENADFVSIE